MAEDHNPVIQNFRKWVDDNSVPGTLGDTERVNSRFMIAQRLETWLKDTTHTRDLLRALWNDDAPPVQPQEIHGKCPRGFAILLLIGKGKYIHHFVRHDNLWDDHMPFNANTRPEDFPTTDVDPDFFKKFVERQWQFFPHTFQQDVVDNHLNPERILPIKSKELIGTGGFADLYKISIHAGYDRLTSSLDQRRDATTGFTNTYVLKTYRTQDAESHYRNEIAAFQRLSYRPGCIGKVVIGFYGSFTQGDTFNVLLEYANGGTLEDFLQKHEPPTNAEDIYKFWKAIFNLTKAIESIHAVAPDPSGPPILRGWHQDIKPVNILVTNSKPENPYDAQFKLADLGLAHFRRIESHASADVDPDTRGTRIYGAPECYRFDDFDEDQPLDVKQSVDIWSLGCVFSEVAVWLVLGKGSLVRYRKNRQVATAELDDFRDQGCFHDGEKVLQCVLTTLDKAFNDIRECDHITRAVIKKMITEMLDEFDGRPNARQLRKKAQNILSDAVRAEKERSTQLGQHASWTPTGKENQHASYHSKSRKMPSQLPPGMVSGSILHDQAVEEPDAVPPTPLKTKSQTMQFENRPLTPASSSRTSFDTTHGDLVPIGHLKLDETSMPSSLRRPDLAPSSATDSNKVDANVPTSIDAMGSSMPNLPATGVTRDIPSGSQDSTPGMADLVMAAGVSNSPPIGSNEQASRETTLSPTEETPPSSTAMLPAAGTGQTASATINSSPKGAEKTATAPKERQKLPTILLRDLENWILKKKKSNSDAFLENKAEIMKELGLRDHIFLIDDAYTMKDYWYAAEGVVNLAKALAYIVKASDKDGMDLYFTCSSGEHNVDSATKMENKLRGKSVQGKSNMAWSLGQILQKYETRLREERRGTAKRTSSFFSHAPKELKPLNVYVFTDAKWQPHCNVAEKVLSIVTTMKELRFPREQVGIQFIQFGDNPECTKKLKDLDDAVDVGIPEDYDIVDTEPAVGGNCWKMLVGAINKWYDKNNEPAKT